ncbi:tRNA-dihydrouridine synthase [Candidatus Roizmanbacteria bacterium]|nr:tRNA-dihydrouridine synthase [Candidatus Roizmanbacteria bacterium]
MANLLERGFWTKLKKPIIGLSPMDGVTDAAFRFVTDTYGHPAILFTEFTSVEGIVHGAGKLLSAFIHHKTATPTVAQVFGADPNGFYQVAFIVAELGFEGIDINMGCPDRSVAKKGGGAGLILQPKVAQEIVKKTRQGVEDWTNGKNIEEVKLPENIVAWVKQFGQSPIPRKILPISLKTRIGYDHIVTESWIKNLLEAAPVNISLHGRTLKQMYTGKADWEEIGKAAALCQATGTTLLGNGDVKSIADAKEKIRTYNLDGVLIGRASFGNPWVFTGVEADYKKRLLVALEHCEALEKLIPDQPFITMRKHLAWYCRGFVGATAVRQKLVLVKNTEEVRQIIFPILHATSEVAAGD